MQFFMVPIAYARMSTCSRRAMLRTKTRFGKPYTYQPRIRLLLRLSRELGMDIEQVRDQIQRERQFLLRMNT